MILPPGLIYFYYFYFMLHKNDSCFTFQKQEPLSFLIGLKYHCYLTMIRKGGICINIHTWLYRCNAIV